MTADDFTAWMAHMGLNKLQTASALAISRNTVTKYMSEGAPDYIALACSALAQGLPKWRKH